MQRRYEHDSALRIGGLLRREALRRIRKGVSRGLPICILSAVLNESMAGYRDAVQALLLRQVAREYLPKPVYRHDVLADI